MTVDALNTALAGLTATKSQIDTISQNISNAQTPGYTTKTQTLTTGPIGAVQLGPVTRNVNQQLETSLNTTAGDVNSLQSTVNLLSQIVSASGTPSSDSSLAASITNLQNAFQDLSVNPEQSSSFSAVINAATQLTTNLNQLSQTVTNTDHDATTQIGQAAAQANTEIQAINQINQQIVAEGTGVDTTNLQDQRDSAISTLAGLMDITTFNKPNGEIAVYTADGKPLVDDSAATITTQNSTVVWNMPPSAPATITVGSGTIGGLQALQTTTLPAVQAQLDDIARALTVSFNSINVPLFNDGGANPLLGTNPALPISFANPVDPVQLNGYSGRIAVNQAIIATPTILRDANSPTPLAPADTTNINAAVALFSSNAIAFNAAGLPATSSFVQAATEFVSSQSAAQSNAQSQLTAAQSLQTQIAAQISAASGVNIDQQVAQLAVLQNAYSANARVLTTTQNIYTALFTAVQ